jgi:formylglycine-generating enzyme required for sulfatase activity
MPVFFCRAMIRAGLILLLIGAGPHCAHASEPTQTVRNSLGMTFVLIPAGSFMMGSPSDEPFRDQSEKYHKVHLTRPFYMQTTEVTFGQWRALMRSFFGLRWSGPEKMPVTKVSWHDIQKFLKKLNRLGEGYYRLPTEAEWEYTARAGSATAYAWGDSINCSMAMFANSRFGAQDCIGKHSALAPDGPAPIQSFAPNNWGVYDMHGNVWELVADWFGPYPAVEVSDPQGPSKGTNRVRRGGSWYGSGYLCRSANRAYSHPGTREVTIGFRLVRER